MRNTVVARKLVVRQHVVPLEFRGGFGKVP
jgi:hypothetical protein